MITLQAFKDTCPKCGGGNLDTILVNNVPIVSEMQLVCGECGLIFLPHFDNSDNFIGYFIQNIVDY